MNSMVQLHDSARFTLIVVAVCALVVAQSCDNFNNEQGTIIERLHAELPTPPGFSEVSSSTISKLSHASTSKTYRSAMPYAEAKAFYASALESHGWTLARERSVTHRGKSSGGYILIFTRGDYSAQLQYAGTPKPDFG